MVEIQAISKILLTQDLTDYKANNITPDYFTDDNRLAYEFILDHSTQYGKVPDPETFVAKFPDFPLRQVSEHNHFLIVGLKEQKLTEEMVPIIHEAYDILKSSAPDAIEFLKQNLPDLNTEFQKGTDIIATATKRFENYQKRCDSTDGYMITTGFAELDKQIGGWLQGDELVVIQSLSGVGKTWILQKMLVGAWQSGKKVMMIEPEMSDISIGFRFDTLLGNISNSALLRGKEAKGYKDYIEWLSQKDTPFLLTTPKDFDRQVTVDKIRDYVLDNKIDILGIDGVSFLRDPACRRSDTRADELGYISQALMDLSREVGIPILVVVQTNREGAKAGGLPELHHVKGSSGIVEAASWVFSLVESGISSITIGNPKSRNNTKLLPLTYTWNPDIGEFKYIPNAEYGDFDKESIEDLKFEFGGDEPF